MPNAALAQCHFSQWCLTSKELAQGVQLKTTKREGHRTKREVVLHVQAFVHETQRSDASEEDVSPAVMNSAMQCCWR